MKFDSVPAVDLDAWQLIIDGLVERPLQLSFNDIISRPAVTMMRTLECIGNPVGGDQIGNAVWGGIGLDDLLAEAGVQAAAVAARFEAADGYETSVTRDWIEQPGVLLAYEMNGAPLAAEHGYPLRLFMPGLYGQKMPKWISRITFTADDDYLGSWEQQGWSNVARVKTNAQIRTPGHIGQVPFDDVEISGLAYAGDRVITRVEIGIEKGDSLDWFEADLLAGPTPQVWTQFYKIWRPPEPGVYTLLVRATDETGFVQTERAKGILEGAFPDGTDKIHNIVVKVAS